MRTIRRACAGILGAAFICLAGCAQSPDSPDFPSLPESEATGAPSRERDMAEELVEQQLLLKYKLAGDTTQEIYHLGTIHSNHLCRDYDYSLAHIQNVIDHINPDLILLEVRPQTLEEHGVLDGPPEMIFAYAYAAEKGIPAKGVDWWEVAPGAQSNTTNDERDDHIFENIVKESPGYSRVLLLTGTGHQIPQRDRLLAHGYFVSAIDDPAALFLGITEETFRYPSAMGKMLEKRIRYEQNDFAKEVENGLPEGAERDSWMDSIPPMCENIQNILERNVLPGELFDESLSREELQ